MNIGQFIISGIVTTMLAFVVGMFYGGFVRKITARVQNRIGPPIYQNFIDVIKLWSKKSNIHHGLMQHLAPLWQIATSITTLMFIPILVDNEFFVNLTFKGDLIFLIYLMVVGALGMALGAGEAGNPNGAIGVTRGLTQMIGFEIPWVMALVALMMQYQTTTITGLMEVQAISGNWLMFTSPFAFLAAVLAMGGMFRYAPFDVVGAPAELMSGPISEFGGKYLGTLMTSGSIFSFVKLVLFVDIFMGGATNLFLLVVKTFALYMVPVLWGIVSPRFRTEQSVKYFWGWPLFFGVLGLIQAAIYTQ